MFVQTEPPGVPSIGTCMSGHRRCGTDLKESYPAPQVQQAVGGFAPEVAVQPVVQGSAGERMASAAPDVGGGVTGATVRAAPPLEQPPLGADRAAADGPSGTEPLDGGAAVGSSAPPGGSSVAVRHMPAAAPATQPAAVAAPVPEPVMGSAEPEPAAVPAPLTATPAVLSTDEALAPASPVLVSPFAGLASVPVRYSLDESDANTVMAPEVCFSDPDPDQPCA